MSRTSSVSARKWQGKLVTLRGKMSDAESSSALRLLRHTRFIVAGTAAMAVVNYRSALTVWIVGGAVIVSGFAKVLKLAIKQPRPGFAISSEPAQSLWKSITTGLLKTDSFGMPSSHSQATSYFSTYLSLLLYKQSLITSNHGYLAAILVVNSFTLSVMQSRVKLRLHTPSQTLVGALLGASFAYLWYNTWENHIVEEGWRWWLEKWVTHAQ